MTVEFPDADTIRVVPGLDGISVKDVDGDTLEGLDVWIKAWVMDGSTQDPDEARPAGLSATLEQQSTITGETEGVVTIDLAKEEVPEGALLARLGLSVSDGQATSETTLHMPVGSAATGGDDGGDDGGDGSAQGTLSLSLTDQTASDPDPYPTSYPYGTVDFTQEATDSEEETIGVEEVRILTVDGEAADYAPSWLEPSVSQTGTDADLDFSIPFEQLQAKTYEIEVTVYNESGLRTKGTFLLDASSITELEFKRIEHVAGETASGTASSFTLSNADWAEGQYLVVAATSRSKVGLTPPAWMELLHEQHHPENNGTHVKLYGGFLPEVAEATFGCDDSAVEVYFIGKAFEGVDPDAPVREVALQHSDGQELYLVFSDFEVPPAGGSRIMVVMASGGLGSSWEWEGHAEFEDSPFSQNIRSSTLGLLADVHTPILGRDRTRPRVLSIGSTYLSLFGGVVLQAELGADPFPSSGELQKALLGAWSDKALGLAWAHAKDGQLLDSGSFGVYRGAWETDGFEAMTPDTWTLMMSISKFVMACGVMRLHEEGELEIDEPFHPLIEEKYPEVGLQASRITSRWLMQGLQGITNNTTDSRADTAAEREDEIEGWLANNAGNRGKNYGYTDAIGAVLAEIIWEVTGQYYVDWVDENLVGPSAGSKMQGELPAEDPPRGFDNNSYGTAGSEAESTLWIGAGGYHASAKAAALWASSLVSEGLFSEGLMGEALDRLHRLESLEGELGRYVGHGGGHGGSHRGAEGQAFLAFLPDRSVVYYSINHEPSPDVRPRVESIISAFEDTFAEAAFVGSDDGAGAKRGFRPLDSDFTPLGRIYGDSGGVRGVCVTSGGDVYMAARDDDHIGRSGLYGKDLTVLPFSSAETNDVYGVGVDEEAGKVYWTSFSGGTLRRGNPDGTSVELLKSGLSWGGLIDVVPSLGKVFVAADTELLSFDLDGTGEQQLATGSGLISCAYEPGEGKLYYCNNGDNEVRRVNPDGTGDETFYTFPGSSTAINGMAIGNGRLYACLVLTDEIKSVALDGTDERTDLSGDLYRDIAIV